MKTRIILSVVVALFVISLLLVVAINIENNQTLSERTEFEIYQDYIDSQKRTDSTMLEWYDIILHSDDDLTDTESDNLELDSFTDVIKAKDMVQTSQYTARRRIEELKEEQRLRKKMESYDNWD